MDNDSPAQTGEPLALQSNDGLGRWLSVCERLPDSDDPVLVYTPKNAHAKVWIDRWQMQREAPLSFSSATIETGFMWDGFEFEDVTHWMPMPALPSGGCTYPQCDCEGPGDDGGSKPPPTNPSLRGDTMKAKPMVLVPGVGYVECEAHEATRLALRIPGPTGLLTLPVLQGNTTRAGTGCWTWNGSTDAPTLRPSVLTQYDGADRQWRCHSWISDGAAQFLADCSHDMANSTVPLLEV